MAAWVCVLALAAQAFAMSWHHPRPQSGALQMVLCTPYGYQVVKLEAGTPTEQPAKDQSKQPSRGCALCAALAYAVFAPPAAEFIPVAPLAVAAAPWIAIGGRLLAARTGLLPQARAPPHRLLA